MATTTQTWMDDTEHDFLMDLLKVKAPSGFEEPAAEIYRSYTQDFADVRTDRVGNVFASVNGKKDHRIGIMGHLDEIGFIVTRVDEPGILKFTSIGGWDPAVACGQRVTVMAQDGPIPGIITRHAIHILGREDAGKIKLDDLWIEIGCKDQEEALELVRPGDPVIVDVEPHLYDNGRLMSRALDDRIGAFIAAEVTKRAAGGENEVVGIGTTREEIGLFGAATAGYGGELDECVVVDVSPAADIPNEKNPWAGTVGEGPVVSIGATTNARLTRALLDLAKSEDIPVQATGAGSFTGTDADAAMPQRGGIPLTVVSIPMRNLHCPGEVIHMDDVKNAIDLITAWVTKKR